MPQLDNAFTTKTEGLHRQGDPDNSMDFIPVNEDWGMLMSATADSVNSGSFCSVTARKINDPTSPKIYTADVRYNGKSGIPASGDIENASTVVFLRNNTGFGLNDWICLIPKPA